MPLGQSKQKSTSRQRSGKGAIRKRLPLQKPRWEKTKLTIRYLYHENSELYFHSFLPSTIREWNTLPRQVQDSPSLSSFRYQLNSNLTKPPAYYTTGSRQDKINHTRIRTRCSALNQHLFSKNVVLSPLCSCVGIENSHHFLLECAL